MEFIDIEKKHKAQMESIRNRYHVTTSAMSFYMTYIWKDIFQHKLYIDDDCYMLKYGHMGEHSFFMPVGKEETKKNLISDLLLDKDTELYMISAEDKAFLEKNFPERFDFEYTLDDSEYIYDIDEICELKGKRISNLRWKYNKFLKSYSDISVTPITKDNMDIAREIIHSWSKERTAQGSANIIGYEADYIVLDLYEEMNFQGIIVSLDGVPASIVIGYGLTEDTFDFMVCKYREHISNIGFISLREMMKQLQGKYKFANLEQDLGIPGLRTLKQQMYPIRMNDMWKAKVKN